MKKTLLSALALTMVASSALAASWSSSTAAQNGTVKVWTATISNLDTSTDELSTDFDLCSSVEFAMDPSATVTPTVVFEVASGSGVSFTEVAAAGISTAGSNTLITDGVSNIQVSVANTTSPSTVSLVLKEYLYKNCRTSGSALR